MMKSIKLILKQKRSYLSILAVCVVLLLNSGILLAGEIRKGIRIIYLDEMKIAPIYIHPHGTVLNFPTKPEVHVGKKDSFNIVYVKNDLVVSANSPNAITNLFIYLLGRRYTLKLIHSGSDGDQIVAIRDPVEQRLEVQIK